MLQHTNIVRNTTATIHTNFSHDDTAAYTYFGKTDCSTRIYLTKQWSCMDTVNILPYKNISPSTATTCIHFTWHNFTKISNKTTLMLGTVSHTLLQHTYFFWNSKEQCHAWNHYIKRLPCFPHKALVQQTILQCDPSTHCYMQMFKTPLHTNIQSIATNKYSKIAIYKYPTHRFIPTFKALLHTTIQDYYIQISNTLLHINIQSIATYRYQTHCCMSHVYFTSKNSCVQISTHCHSPKQILTQWCMYIWNFHAIRLLRIGTFSKKCCCTQTFCIRLRAIRKSYMIILLHANNLHDCTAI